MPRRPMELADVGFSLPGLTSYLQDVLKEQQKIILHQGRLLQLCRGFSPCCSSLGVLHLSQGAVGNGL